MLGHSRQRAAYDHDMGQDPELPAVLRRVALHIAHIKSKELDPGPDHPFPVFRDPVLSVHHRRKEKTQAKQGHQGSRMAFLRIF